MADADVASFLALTGSSAGDTYLKLTGGNLEDAVGLFFEQPDLGNGGGGNGGGGGTPGMSDVRIEGGLRLVS